MTVLCIPVLHSCCPQYRSPSLPSPPLFSFSPPLLFLLPSPPPPLSTPLTSAVTRPMKHPSKKEPTKIPMKVPMDLKRLTTWKPVSLYSSTDLEKTTD